jgi:signal transduction histidine kinase
MRVSTKLSASYGILVLLLIVMLVYELGTMRRAISTGYDLSRIFTRLELTSTQQLDGLNVMEEAASKFAVTRDPRYRESFEAMQLAFDSSLVRMESMPLGQRERAELNALRVLWAAFPVRVAAFQLAVAARDRAAPGELSELIQQVAELRASSRRLATASRDAIRQGLEQSAEAARAAERVALAIAVAALLFSVLVGVWIVRSIADPLHRLQNATQQVADGNFDYRLTGLRDDEFAMLAAAFNRMTQRLAELERMKRDFLSKFSHDLKTPLASMQETSRVVLDGVSGELTAKQRRLLELNHQSGQRLSGMISKILDLSAMEAGAVRIEMLWHDLNELVRRSVELAASSVDESRVRIVTEYAEGSVLVECDAERILRVLDNLFENALKFSPAGGTIHVMVRIVEDRPEGVPSDKWREIRQPDAGRTVALIAVDDEGPGVPAAEREKIFDRFYQSVGGRNVQNRGVGLGLAICREIVTAHGGAIWVQESTTGGSSFRLLLTNAQSASVEPLSNVSVRA